MSVSTLTLDGEEHVILPHYPDWATKPDHGRAWLDGVAGAVNTAEDRQTLRDQPAVSLGWEILPCDLVETRMLEARIREALKSGLAVSAYWGRGFTLAQTASGSTIYVQATRWRFHAGQKLFFRQPGACSHDGEWEIATIDYVHDCLDPVEIKLTSSLSGTYLSGTFCWPLLWGKFEAEELNALHLGRGSIQVRIRQRVPFPPDNMPVPAVPTVLNLFEPVPGTLDFSWTLPDEAIWSEVQRKFNGGDWEDMGTFARDPFGDNYTDEPGVSGTYCYRVRGVNCQGAGDWTDEECIVLDLGSESGSGSEGLPQLGSVFLWLDSSFGVSDPVSSWTDRSGNSNHATQGDSGKQPALLTSQINGLPAVHFGADFDELVLPDVTWDLSMGLTILAVFKAESANAPRQLLSLAETFPGPDHWTRLGGTNASSNGAYQCTVGDVQLIEDAPLPNFATGSFQLVTLIHGDVDARYFRGGTETARPDADGGPGNVLRNNNRVGGNAGSGTINQVWLAELIAIRRVLSDSDRQAWEAYLTTKYNL